MVKLNDQELFETTALSNNAMNDFKNIDFSLFNFTCYYENFKIPVIIWLNNENVFIPYYHNNAAKKLLTKKLTLNLFNPDILNYHDCLISDKYFIKKNQTIINSASSSNKFNISGIFLGNTYIIEFIHPPQKDKDIISTLPITIFNDLGNNVFIFNLNGNLIVNTSKRRCNNFLNVFGRGYKELLESSIFETYLKQEKKTVKIYLKKGTTQNVYKLILIPLGCNLIAAIKHDITVDNRHKIYKKYLNCIWDNLSEGIRLTDYNGKVIRVNEVFCNMFKVNGKDIIGQPSNLLYKDNSGNDNEKFIELYKQNFDKTNFNLITEERITLVSGEVLYLNIYRFAIGHIAHPLILTIFKDISTQKKSEIVDNQDKKFIEIGRLFSILTHKMNNPLSSIKLAVQLLPENNISDENKTILLGCLNEKVNFLESLIKNLSLYIKEDFYQLNFIDISKIIEGAILKSQDKLIDKSIKIDNKISRYFIKGNEHLLIQLFSILIDNSCDAINENGGIIITPEISDGDLNIFISDNGCGIKDVEKLFTLFYSTKQSGTGMGLPIARKIMNLHKGNIDLLLTEPGKTIFRITFKRNI